MTGYLYIESSRSRDCRIPVYVTFLMASCCNMNIHDKLVRKVDGPSTVVPLDGL